MQPLARSIMPHLREVKEEDEPLWSIVELDRSLCVWAKGSIRANYLVFVPIGTEIS